MPKLSYVLQNYKSYYLSEVLHCISETAPEDITGDNLNEAFKTGYAVIVGCVVAKINPKLITGDHLTTAIETVGCKYVAEEINPELITGNHLTLGIKNKSPFTVGAKLIAENINPKHLTEKHYLAALASEHEILADIIKRNMPVKVKLKNKFQEITANVKNAFSRQR